MTTPRHRSPEPPPRRWVWQPRPRGWVLAAVGATVGLTVAPAMALASSAAPKPDVDVTAEEPPRSVPTLRSLVAEPLPVADPTLPPAFDPGKAPGDASAAPQRTVSASQGPTWTEEATPTTPDAPTGAEGVPTATSSPATPTIDTTRPTEIPTSTPIGTCWAHVPQQPAPCTPPPTTTAPTTTAPATTTAPSPSAPATTAPQITDVIEDVPLPTSGEEQDDEMP